jgi:hypothetical protein
VARPDGHLVDSATGWSTLAVPAVAVYVAVNLAVTTAAIGGMDGIEPTQDASTAPRKRFEDRGPSVRGRP